MKTSLLDIPATQPARSRSLDEADTLPLRGATDRRNQHLQPPALAAGRIFIGPDDSKIALYYSTPQPGEAGRNLTPLVLVHSVNAAGSAAEVRPIFDAVAGSRPVVAVELPGFGSSARPLREYTPKLMSEAVLAAVGELRRIGYPGPVDLLAVSLSCEFAARAALLQPTWFRTVSLVSPTGLESRRLEPYAAGRSKDKPWLRHLLERGPWADWLFKRLTSEASMRKFLERAWGSRHIDEPLLAYNRVSVQQPGARHAPYAFIAGALFTRGVAHLYQRLPQPVWMATGVRGGFSKFDGVDTLRPVSKWSVNSFDAGAMPYFETTADFMDCFQRFLDGVQARTASPAGSR